MRLICGLLHLDGASADEGLLRRLAAEMAVPRQRPALRLRLDGPAGLAVLDFADPGAAETSLPAEGEALLAADLRLDEPEALRERLGAPAATGEDRLLLSVLERLGPAGLERVLGDFAFACWNRGTGRLVCGRDAMGIRPFAYAHRPGRLFAFASLQKALHGSGIVPRRIDEATLARRLALVFEPEDALIAGIRLLPAAHWLEVSRDGIALGRYWQPDRAALGRNRQPPAAAAAELRRLIGQAVACRLSRRRGTGAHLSGGLDSAAVAVLAARRLREAGRRLHAYTILDRKDEGDSPDDEIAFVRLVLAQEPDIDWTPIRPPPALARLDSPLDPDKMRSLAADEPDNAVCARAEQQGVDVVLSGWGGDEGASFNGRGLLADLFRRGRWATLAREVASLRRRRGARLSRILYHEVLGPLLLGTLVARLRRGHPGRGRIALESRQLLTDAADLGPAMAGAEGPAAGADETRWRLATGRHLAERAEVWALAGARHGVSFAFPLLDRRVVEYVLSLPAELFLREGRRRRLFQDAMAGVLPDRLRLRPTKFPPVPTGMPEFAASRALLLERIDAFERHEAVRRLVDLGRVRRLVEAFTPGTPAVGGRPPDNVPKIVVLRALTAAAYLCQHATPP